MMCTVVGSLKSASVVRAEAPAGAALASTAAAAADDKGASPLPPPLLPLPATGEAAPLTPAAASFASLDSAALSAHHTRHIRRSARDRETLRTQNDLVSCRRDCGTPE